MGSRLDTEPNEREMQALVRLWTIAYARNDSFSAVNDAVHAARYMVAENTTLDLAYDGAGRWSVEVRLRRL